MHYCKCLPITDATAKSEPNIFCCGHAEFKLPSPDFRFNIHHKMYNALKHKISLCKTD